MQNQAIYKQYAENIDINKVRNNKINNIKNNYKK